MLLPLSIIPPGRYIVAVSGGVDSMVLLDALSKQPGLDLVVAHFDHGTREDSASDARFVARTAKRLGCEFATERAELGAQVSEDSARKARYDFLHRAVVRCGARAIITAHHQDDVVETAIINLLRGTGWRGLASLCSTAKVIRPMLYASKVDILAYAQEHRLAWREDSTNADLRYLRNRVRLRLMPLINARDREAIADLLGLIGTGQRLRTEIEQDVQALVGGVIKNEGNELHVKRVDLVRLPLVVCLEVLRAMAVETSGSALERPMLHRMRVFACCARPGKHMEITKNLTMRVLGDSVIVYNR